MKLDSVIPSRATLTLMCGVAFAAGIVNFRANADAWDKKTVLTVNQTIQVRERVLEPGQYVLKLYDSSSERHVVQIFNADQSRIIDTIIAIPKQRMEPTGDSAFTFWETPAGKARALRAWFYPGDTIGQEFPYPKHLMDVAMAETTTVAAPPPPVSQPAEPAPTTQPEAETHEQPAQQPTEVAEAAPPPPTPEPQPETPEPQPAPQPAKELPKTGSLYPLAGVGGGILLGILALLRLKRYA